MNKSDPHQPGSFSSAGSADTPNRKEDIHTTDSALSGFPRVVEILFRNFKTLGFLALLMPLILLYALSLGLSLAPGVFLCVWLWESLAQEILLTKIILMSLGMGVSWLMFMVTMIFIVPLFNWPIRPWVKPLRCIWYSLAIIPWFYHNALTQLVRYTVLDILTPTPLSMLFFRMMGMKMGQGCIINTSNISDPCLVTLGDYVTIGGSVTLFAHYGMKGYLIVEPVVIASGTTIGLKASVMGGAHIGRNNMIAPHAVVMPKQRIPDQDPD